MNPPVPIDGGWNFVMAAYVITWLGLIVYGGYLLTREKSDTPPEPEKDKR